MTVVVITVANGFNIVLNWNLLPSDLLLDLERQLCFLLVNVVPADTIEERVILDLLGSSRASSKSV